MNTLQLNSALEKDPALSKITTGVFAANRLPLMFKKHPQFLILNTDVSTGPGEHWVALYIPQDGRPVEFWDSLARPPGYYHKRFEQCCIINGPSYMMTNTRVQDFTSDVCGQYTYTLVIGRPGVIPWKQL